MLLKCCMNSKSSRHLSGESSDIVQKFLTQEGQNYTANRLNKFKDEIEKIANFLKLDLEEVRKFCSDEINARYEREYGQLPEKDNLISNHRNDSIYKRHQKIIQWFSMNFEEKTGSRIEQAVILKNFKNSIFIVIFSLVLLKFNHN